MKERLEKLIAEAKQEWLRYCLTTNESLKTSEAAFIADKLCEAGVCFRLVVPRKGEKANDL